MPSSNLESLNLDRDIFLSHRSIDKEFVRQLAEDIESQTFEGRNLLSWLDEAEIRPGQSIPGMINQGLERSRFIGLVMTPVYFESGSGWTDAEWHSALYSDPDNRNARIIPFLVQDCPYIPTLLRHLRLIDFRGRRYQQGLQELISVLRNEPLPRPITYRGQLVASTGRVDRATLIAERAIPDAYPDVVNEKLYCNLLPVERLPSYIYIGSVAEKILKTRRGGGTALPSKRELITAIRQAQMQSGTERPFTPAFRLVENDIITFHDLESPDGPLETIIEENSVEKVPVADFLLDEDDRRIVTSLLNMALSRHAHRIGLVADDTKHDRFLFPPKNGGANIVSWTPLKKRTSRTVAKPCLDDRGVTLFWRHLGAYLKMLFLANRYYLQITPTWVITEDGFKVRGGPRVGKLVIKWTGSERNLHLLYHVRFWSTILRNGRGPISIRAGDQRVDLSSIPAYIEQAHGIANDRKDLLGLLDQEAPIIAEQEEEQLEEVIQSNLGEGMEETDYDDPFVEDIAQKDEDDE